VTGVARVVLAQRAVKKKKVSETRIVRCSEESDTGEYLLRMRSCLKVSRETNKMKKV
jgi:ribosomal protein L32